MQLDKRLNCQHRIAKAEETKDLDVMKGIFSKVEKDATSLKDYNLPYKLSSSDFANQIYIVLREFFVGKFILQSQSIHCVFTSGNVFNVNIEKLN